MRVLVILALSGTLGILGCGESSDGGTAGTSGSGGSGGSGGSAGTGGTGGQAGGGGAGGEAGGGGDGGGGGTASSAQFCDDFEDTCSYGGDNYFNRAACMSSYDAYEEPRRECVTEHLGFAAGEDPGAARDAHCAHASGQPPCA